MKFAYAQISDSLFRQEYSLSRAQEYIEMLLYATISFSLPFLLGHEQLLVGAVVNCALVLAALNLKGARLLPVIILPSIGAYLAGLIFGAASTALLCMLPLIWVGNAILVLCIKYFVLGDANPAGFASADKALQSFVFDKKTNRIAALGIGATAKAAFLFIAAFALLSFSMVPAVFLTAMGIFQLMTAAMGGAAALALQAGKKRFLAA